MTETTNLGVVIERDVIRRVAIADISNDGGVELIQRRKRTVYTPAEAMELGQRLLDLGMQAALDADADRVRNEAAWDAAGDAFSGAVRPAHGFDVDQAAPALDLPGFASWQAALDWMVDLVGWDPSKDGGDPRDARRELVRRARARIVEGSVVETLVAQAEAVLRGEGVL